MPRTGQLAMYVSRARSRSRAVLWTSDCPIVDGNPSAQTDREGFSGDGLGRPTTSEDRRPRKTPPDPSLTSNCAAAARGELHHGLPVAAGRERCGWGRWAGCMAATLALAAQDTH